MSERQGIEIDYCPRCRGVWLDRGEVDKLVERSATEYGGDERDAGGRDDAHRPGAGAGTTSARGGKKKAAAPSSVTRSSWGATSPVRPASCL